MSSLSINTGDPTIAVASIDSSSSSRSEMIIYSTEIEGDKLNQIHHLSTVPGQSFDYSNDLDLKIELIKHGYIHIKNVFPTDILSNFCNSINTLDATNGLNPQQFKYGYTVDCEDGLIIGGSNKPVQLNQSYLKDITTRLINVMQNSFQEHVSFVKGQQFVRIKQSTHTRGTPCHKDSTFYDKPENKHKTNNSASLVTCWILLTPFPSATSSQPPVLLIQPANLTSLPNVPKSISNPVTPESSAAVPWNRIQPAVGDLVIFHSFTPHCSPMFSTVNRISLDTRLICQPFGPLQSISNTPTTAAQPYRHVHGTAQTDTVSTSIASHSHSHLDQINMNTHMHETISDQSNLHLPVKKRRMDSSVSSPNDNPLTMVRYTILYMQVDT